MALLTCNTCGEIKDESKFGKTATGRRRKCQLCRSRERSKKAITAQNVTKDTILCIPDIQSPAHHPDTLDFLLAVKNKYNPSRILLGGDEWDKYYLSSFDKDPDAESATEEIAEAQAFFARFFNIFPEGEGVVSNHVHGRIEKKRMKAGIPSIYFKGFEELIGAPDGWSWKDSILIDCGKSNIFIAHGHKHKKAVMKEVEYYSNWFCKPTSVLLFHHHTEFGSKGDMMINKQLVWGGFGGSLIDKDRHNFSYTQRYPVLGCTLIIDGRLHPILMDVDSDNRWTGKV